MVEVKCSWDEELDQGCCDSLEYFEYLWMACVMSSLYVHSSPCACVWLGWVLTGLDSLGSEL